MDLPTLLSGLAGFVFVAGSVEEFWRDRRRSPVGAEGLVGKLARVLPPERAGEAPGWVAVGGERWRASARGPLRPGSRVRIEAVRGLELAVVEADAASVAPRTRAAVRPRWQWAPGLALWGVAIAAAALSAGSLQGALAAGPLVVLVCYGAIAALAVGAD